jgi:glycosyltransferase involved in cell wall biosynthesis
VNKHLSVLVGITTRNRASTLTKTLDSIHHQDYPDLCVRVIDDASTDQTPAICRSFPKVLYTRNEKPVGLIRNRNRLMLESKAEIFICLDDDAWFQRDDEISIACEYFSRHEECAAIAFDILSPDQPEVDQRREALPVPLFIGCGHALRLETIQAIGGYASFPGTYGAEEKDLCLRLFENGSTIIFLPGVHVWHQKEWSQRDWTQTRRDGICNDLAVTVWRCPFPDILWMLPGQILNHFIFGVSRHNLPTFWKGILQWLRHLPQLIQQRDPIQSKNFRAFRSIGKQRSQNPQEITP